MSSPTPSPSTVRQRFLRFSALVSVVCVWALLLSGPVPAAAQIDELQQRLDQVEAEQAELSATLETATARVDDLTGRLAQVRDRSDDLRAEVAQLSKREARARTLMDRRLIAIYKGDRANGLMAFATGSSLTELSSRTHYLSALTRNDAERFQQAAALIAATEARRSELAQVDARLDDLVAEAAEAQADLDAKFAAAGEAHESLSAEITRQREEARRLAAEAAERRRAAAAAAEAQEAARELAAAEAAERRAEAASRSADRAASSAPAPPPAGSSGGSGGGGGGKVCPQDNPRSFTDTWGAPRSGGRTHQGTDIFGARGGDVFAIVSGTIEWTSNGSMSGLWLSVRGNDGHQYWYMHLQDFVAHAGQRVAAGQLIAHNGDTGNAQGTTPHIHFEYHPGGGGAVNPYPLLKSVCG